MGLSEELGTLHRGKEFQVSLSSLETGEKNFKFLFFFSIVFFEPFLLNVQLFEIFVSSKFLDLRDAC